jgi:hypothetical protein
MLAGATTRSIAVAWLFVLRMIPGSSPGTSLVGKPLHTPDQVEGKLFGIMR